MNKNKTIITMIILTLPYILFFINLYQVYR